MSHNRRFLPHAVRNFLWGSSSSRNTTETQDREMTPVEVLDHPVQPLDRPDETDNRSDTSMPDLQSVSDSGSESDNDSQEERDVEMHVVDDDNNHDWTDDEENVGMPPLEPITPSPPATATTNTTAAPTREDTPEPPRPQLPPWSFGLGTAPNQAQPDFRHIFPLFPPPRPRTQPDNIPNPTPTHATPTQSEPHPQANEPPRPRVRGHAYVVAIDANGRPIPIAMGPAMGPPPPPTGGAPRGLPMFEFMTGATAPPPPPPPTDGPATPLGPGIPVFDFIIGGNGGAGMAGGFFNGFPPFAGDIPTWPEVMQMFGREIEEVEDPERAKKLVAGLEVVPVGLVKRMIRVGGAPGAHTDQAASPESDTPGCAICWDSLLDDEITTDETEEIKIISLPCSHVFHASCLTPWFSKPKHTTCPTCRFNIDPENLTYNPSHRRPANPAGEQPAPATAAPAATENPTAAENPTPPSVPTVENSVPTGAPTQQPTAPEGEQTLPQLLRQAAGFPFGPLPPLFDTFPFAPTGAPPAQPIPTPVAPARVERRDHAHGPGFTVDFTWQAPVTNDQDEERVAADLQNQATNFIQQFLGNLGGMGAPTLPPFARGAGSPGPGPIPRGPRPPPTPRVRKEWTPPPAPGPTLRQRVESKEREAGLRCDDPSCGIGPSDEDPQPTSLVDAASCARKQITIEGEGCTCVHRFHPACLVSADRCSGWGEDRTRAAGGEDEDVYEVVACPMCRSVGRVDRGIWEEGAEALRALEC